MEDPAEDSKLSLSTKFEKPSVALEKATSLQVKVGQAEDTDLLLDDSTDQSSTADSLLDEITSQSARGQYDTDYFERDASLRKPHRAKLRNTTETGDITVKSGSLG